MMATGTYQQFYQHRWPEGHAVVPLACTNLRDAYAQPGSSIIVPGVFVGGRSAGRQVRIGFWNRLSLIFAPLFKDFRM